MLIDIVIIPTVRIRKKIGQKIKTAVGNIPNFFVVDNTKLLPHLSLWHMKTSPKKIDELELQLQHSVKDKKAIKIDSLEFETQERGYMGFSVKENPHLGSFREEILKNAYMFKTELMPPYPAAFLHTKYSKAQQKEIEKYGKLTRFYPHFTMGWLKNPTNLDEVKKKMQEVNFSFVAKEIYICEINTWWQVRRIIKKIKF